MTSLDDLTRAMTWAFRLSRIPATLGDGQGNVDDVDNPGYVWVSYQDDDGVSVVRSVRLRAVMAKIAGAAVKLGWDSDYQLAVVEADFTRQIDQGINPGVNNPSDRQVFEFIDENRLQTLKCYAVATESEPTTEVVILDWLYRRGTTWFWFQAQRVDLGGYIPASGSHLLAAIWIDTNNTVEVTVSTAQDVLEPLGVDDIQECQDAASAGAVPVHIWRLYGGQTTVVESDSMGNLRQRLNLPGYEIVQDDGVNMAQRQKLNLRAGTGMTMTITDDAGNDVTDVLFEAAGGYGGYGSYFEYVSVDYGDVYQHEQLNFIAGSNVTFVVTEDVSPDRLNIEISAAAGSGGYEVVQDDGVDVPQRSKLNLVGGSNMTLTITDDAGNDVTDVLFETTGGDSYFNYVGYDAEGYYQRQKLNLVAGTNITFNVVDNAIDDSLSVEVDTHAEFYPHDYISGFEVTVYVSLGYSYVSIAPGECVGEDGKLYKRTTAEGSIVFNESQVGSEPSGFLEGSLTTGAWYPIFLITNGSLLGGWVGTRNSSSTGTLPSGYSKVRQIGYAKTWNASADFVPSMMITDGYGRRFVNWMTDINSETTHELAPASFGLSGITFTGKDYSASIAPSSRRAVFHFRASATGANGSVYYQFSNAPPYDTMDIQVTLLVVGDVVNTTTELLVSESRYISFRSRSVSATETIFCYVTGYFCNAHKTAYT